MKAIAEYGSNWQTLDHILESCDFIVKSGAIPKGQLFITEKVVNKDRAPKMFDTMKRYEVPQAWVEKIAYHFPMAFWSVFDTDSIDFLEAKVNPNYYKIASGDCDNYPLIERAMNTGKPVFISTGGGKPEAVVKDAIYFHCISAYPAPHAYLGNLIDTQYEGYSDHTMSMVTPAMCVAKGVKYYERHFKLHDMPTPDAPHSLDKAGWTRLMEVVREAEGHMAFANQPLECELTNHRLGRRGSDGLRPREVW